MGLKEIVIKNIVVLYTEKVNFNFKKPFQADDANRAYELFSILMGRRSLNMYIAPFCEYNGGFVDKAFHFADGIWNVEEKVRVDMIFDKYTYSEEVLDLKKEIEDIHPVLNKLLVEDFCKDKLKIVKYLPEYSPITKVINNRKELIEKLYEFKTDKIVLKPRFGSEGIDVNIVDRKNIPLYVEKDTLMQEFIDTSCGIPGTNISGVHDIRLIFIDGKFVLNQVRQPSTGFVSNASKGGTKLFLENEKIPKILFEISSKVQELFKDVRNSIFTVDFIYDKDGKPFILELNTKPGIVKYPGRKDVQIKLMNAIIDSIEDSLK